MSEKKYRPCPFCGSNELVDLGPDCVECDSCGATGPTKKFGGGRKGWNKRAEDKKHKADWAFAELQFQDLRSQLEGAKAEIAELTAETERVDKVQVTLDLQCTTLQRQLIAAEATIEQFDTKEADCGHLNRWWKVEPNQDAWCVMCALEKAMGQK